MPERCSYDYAILRIVPRVDREEFVNAGALVFCSERNFLAVKVHVDPARLRALWPELDVDLARERLQAFVRICAAEREAGPIAQLSKRERFHWMVSPRSTIIQVSPAHSGLCVEPEIALEEIFRELVLM